jgi:hypothetical protein
MARGEERRKKKEERRRKHRPLALLRVAQVRIEDV